MLSTLNYSVTFANEKTISRELTFEETGSTLITGANEAGKSLNLEMIGFALFGSEALRGKATDYKRIKCRVTITINGTKHVIERVKSNAKLITNSEEIAVGTTAVNAAIVALLGFDFKVYRIAHIAEQGDLQALAAMKPTERKAMVDTVAGLNQLDDVIADLATDLKVKRAELEAHKTFVCELTSPIEPSLTIESLDEAIALQQQRQREIYTNQNIKRPDPVLLEDALVTMPEPLKYAPFVLPQSPDAPCVPEEYSEDTYQQLKSLVEPLESHQMLLELQLVEPELDLEQVKQVREHNALFERQQERDKLRAKGSLECEKCGHSNHLASELLAGYVDVPETVLLRVDYNERQLTEIEIKWEQYKESLIDQQAAQKYVDSYSQLQTPFALWTTYRQKLAQYQITFDQYEIKVADLEKRNADLDANYSRELTRVTDFNASVLTRNIEIEQRNTHRQDLFNQALAEFDAAQDKITPDVLREHQHEDRRLQSLIAEWRQFEANVNLYNREFENQQQLAKKLVGLEKNIVDIERGRKSLKDTKVAVKSYLTPSLSRVASRLLNEMTGGARTVVVVDEDFEVTVDGQPLRTLSGSAKDIVNLTIRIGLGQILTHKVLPLMCLDEIDQGMDAERSRYTQECIKNITPQIGQVLIVSHRPSISDHKIHI